VRYRFVLGLKDKDEAQRQYEKILKSNPDYASAIYGLGGIYWTRDRDYKRAKEMIEKAISMAPDDDTLKQNLKEFERLAFLERDKIIRKALREGKIKLGELCKVDFKTGEVISA
jgi:tetratricopeptide (TPR) repeat protein